MGYIANLGQALLGRQLSRAIAGKASAVGPMIARYMAGQPVWSGRDYERLSREAYQQNATVNRCVTIVANAVASLPIIAYKGKGKNKKELDEHPVLDLLKNPNLEQDGVALLKSIVSYYLITGNAYIERTDENDPEKMELYAWRPDRTNIVPGADGMIEAYEYKANGATRRLEIEPDAGIRPILHLKTFNPLNDWYGQSPLDACSWAIDICNEASAWNLGILKNSGAPSGAFVYGGSEDSGYAMPEDLHQQLKRELDENIKGSRNAGKPMLLGGGLTWQQMSLDPERMQYIEGANRAAREIADNLGVPPMMLQIPGDNTYSNYQEARQAFYQDTVIPLAKRIVSALEHWFARQLGEDVHLDINVDGLHALSEARKELWQAVQTSTFLSINEKREACGYEPVEGGDDVYVGAGQIPLNMPSTIAGDGAAADPKPNKKPPPADKPKGGAFYLEGTVHNKSDVP